MPVDDPQTPAMNTSRTQGHYYGPGIRAALNEA